MLFNYNKQSLKSGIYKIVNTHTNRVYIGQAKEFKARWKGHCRSLLSDKHQNKFLQADFNKCREALGHDDFLEFHILELLPNSTKEDRNQREEVWLAQWFDGGKQCYNLTPHALSREGVKDRSPEASFQRRSAAVKGRKHSPEAIQRMSEAQMAANNPRNTGKTLSAETKEKISKANQGRVFTEAHRKKLSEAAKKRTRTRI